MLSPLVPQLKDLLEEYQEAGNGKIQVEYVDPATNADLEEEAASKYGIRPVPFRVADRYQSAVVNSYFHILVRYGDEYKVLAFRDLITIKAASEADAEVQLRNPEYDITNAIKQALYAYQSGGDLFDGIAAPVTLTAYLSPKTALPGALPALADSLAAVSAEMAQQSDGKFTLQLVDPHADGGAVAAQIAEQYGFRPMASSVIDTHRFYFYMVLNSDSLSVQVPLPEGLSEDRLRANIEAGLRRFASGFTKTIGMALPEAGVYEGAGDSTFNALQQLLGDNFTPKAVDLAVGRVDEDVDLLMLMAPGSLSERAVFAVDQFLMQGGTVIAATSPIKTSNSQGSLYADLHETGLADWLVHNGIAIDESLVMDLQSAAFPIPVMRQVGGSAVRELVLLAYPYFIDVRDGGLNAENPITSELPQITIPWASPMSIDAEKNAQRKIIELARSSESSWISHDMNINPQVDENGRSQFAAKPGMGSQLLAVAIEGRFESLFKGRESPLLTLNETDLADSADEDVISAVIDHSSHSARLIVVSSNEFSTDALLGTLGSVEGTAYTAPIQFLANASEWSLDDEGLSGIRARDYFNRTLPPTDDDRRQFWELLNYGLALLGLLAIYLLRRWQASGARRNYRHILSMSSEGRG